MPLYSSHHPLCILLPRGMSNHGGHCSLHESQARVRALHDFSPLVPVGALGGRSYGYPISPRRTWRHREVKYPRRQFQLVGGGGLNPLSLNAIHASLLMNE